MGTFIVTYDTHFARDYDAFYNAMNEHGGVRLNESVWGIELENTAAEVRDWARNLLDNDDTIVVLQLKPRLSWASRNAETDANNWLKQSL